MLTALIVEDEPEANKLLSLLVQLQGYRTESAYNGAEALEKVRAISPDVVFLDLMLPDIDGYDICRQLKTPSPGPAIPVIIVTARLAAENRIESFAAGADDYVPKPYTPDQIFAALDQASAWKEKIDEPEVEGRVPLDGRDDGETLRELSGLRNLLSAPLLWCLTKSISSARPSIRSGQVPINGRDATSEIGPPSWPIRSRALD